MNWRTTARRMIIDQVIVVALAVVRILSFLSTFFTHDDHQSEEGDEKSQSHRDGGSASPVAMKPVAADCLISGLAFGLYKSLMLSYHCFEPLASLFDIPNPTPPLFAVSDITATSVKLSWTVDESGKPCKRGRLIIEVNGLVVGELRCDETAVVVGRLKPAQRYRFRVWAEGAGAGGIVRRGTSEILVRTLDDDVEKPVAIENLVPIEPKIVKAEIEKHDKTEKSELLEDAESIRTQIEQLENVIANTEQSNAHLEHSLRTQLSALESQRVPPDPAVKSALAELQGQLEQQEEELKNAEIQRSSLRKTLDERKSVYQKQKDQLQSLKEQCGEFVNRKDGKMDSASNTKDPHKEKDSKEELEKQIRELDARWEESKVLLKQLQTRKQDLEREALEVRKARYTAMTSAIPEYPVDVLSVEPVSLASQLEFGPEERRAFRNEMEMMRESLYISPTDVDHSVPDLGVLEIAHERPLETKKATLNPLAPAWQSPDPVVTHHTGDSSSSASMARSTTSRLDPRAPEWEAASYESEWGSGWNTAVGMQREAHGYGDIQGENPSVNNEKLDLEEVWGPGLRDDAWAASPSAVGERLSNLVTDMDMEEIAAVSGSVSGHNVPTTWSEPLRDTWPAPPNVVPVDLSGTLPAPPYKHTWHAPAKDRARDMVLKSRRSCDVGGIWSQHHGGGASGSGRGRSTSSYEHFATGLFGNIGTASPSLPLKTPYVGEPFSGMLDGRSSPGMPISGRKEGRSNSYGDTSTTEKPQLMPRMTGTPTPGGFHTLSPSSSTANSNMNLKGGVSTTSLSTTSCSVTDVVAPVPREFTRSALLSPYPSLGNVHGGSDRYATGEGGRLMATPPPPGFETKSLRGVSGSGGSVHRGDGSVGEERERDREHARTRSLGVWGVWGWEEK
ncbi:hypothetical protein BC832DRAFT_132610 [Gaertneriomyces semiglobifer]|nr:hypothetical protein BC832DRAFT_132610 [Gaertneriomyces semiglobifer]